MPTPLTWPLAAPTVTAPAFATSAATSSGSSTSADGTYGTDFSTYPDLDWGAEISGSEAVIQAIARSLEDAQIGVDIRTSLNADLDAADLYSLEQTIRARCLAEERCESAEVSVVQTDATSTLTVEIYISLADDSTPFRLVLAVTELGVQILTES